MSAAAHCFSQREPIEAYLAREDYVSSSQLRRMTRPAMGRFDGSGMGDALHAYLLEPDLFEQRYLVLDGSVPADVRISERDAMARVWLSPGQHAALRWAREAIGRYTREPLARWYESGEKELSIYWRDARGAGWKARPDCYSSEIVLEFKTTGDVRPDAFAATRERLGYDLQAAHYLEAVQRLTGASPRFAFVAFELTEPRNLWVHELAGAELARAHERLAAARAEYLRLRGG